MVMYVCRLYGLHATEYLPCGLNCAGGVAEHPYSLCLLSKGLARLISKTLP